MNPRQPEQNSLPLPIELFQYSGQFMTGLQFVAAMRLVSRRFHGLFKFTNNQFWAELYRRDFGPLPSDTVTDEVKDASRDETMDLDVKIQYIAAHLNQCACAEPRHDIAQIKFRRLAEFLRPHANKNWAKFYLAKMRYEGQGMLANNKRGLKLLHDCLGWYDYRAAIMIVNILLQDEIHGIEIPDFHLVVASLRAAYDKGYVKAALTLGILYEQGYLGLPQDFAESEKWYLRALAANMSGVVDCLINQKFNNNQTHIELPVKDQHKIESVYLNELLTQHPKCTTVIGDIHFTIAKMHENGSEEYLSHMRQANNLGHFPAKRSLGKYYLKSAKDQKLDRNKSQEALLEAILLLEEGFNAKQPDFIIPLHSAYLFAQALQGPDLAPDNIYRNLMKNGDKNNRYVIGRVSYYILETFEWDELIDNAEMIWWLQVAAQSFDTDAFAFLKSLESENDNPYILCALGIIATYGILGADNANKMGASKSKADKYFAMAFECNENSMAEYLKTGREIGFICKEVELLLEKQIEILKTPKVSISKP